MILLIWDGTDLVTYAFMMGNCWAAHTIEILLEFGLRIYRYSLDLNLFPGYSFLCSFETPIVVFETETCESL